MSKRSNIIKKAKGLLVCSLVWLLLLPAVFSAAQETQQTTETQQVVQETPSWMLGTADNDIDVQINPEVYEFAKANQSQKAWWNKALNTISNTGLLNNLEKLRNAANGEYVVDWGQTIIFNAHKESQYKAPTILGMEWTKTDSKMTDILQQVKRAAEDLARDKKITTAYRDLILAEAERLYKIGAERAQKKYEQRGKTEAITNVQSEVNEAVVEHHEIALCPLMEEMELKYTSNCYTCLVVEKLISSFMTAAGKAFSVTQTAAIKLLILGTVLWMMLFGLKYLSSLTSVEPANMLDTLLKFLFKVMVASIAIKMGIGVITSYIINPIMGFGADIAQGFWHKDIEEQIEMYSWDYDEAAVDVEEKEGWEKLEQTPIPPETPEELAKKSTQTEEQAKLLEEQQKLDNSLVDADIPKFLIPGTNTGHLTSPPGCRVPPRTKNGSGSTSHMGLDIGTSGIQGGVVYAMAPGIISYTSGSSTGNMASIRTIDKNGNVWTHRYLHMQNRVNSDFVPKLNGRKVSAGQQIGYIGHTGKSTGAHLHIDIKFSGTFNGKKFNDVYVDPLRLSQNVFYVLNKGRCDGTYVDTFPAGFVRGQNVPAKGWPVPGGKVVDLSSTYVGTSAPGMSGTYGVGFTAMPTLDIKYRGPTNILSKSVIENLLTATKIITDKTALTMILGNGLICTATTVDVWKNFGKTFKCIFWFITGDCSVIGDMMSNLWMWIVGAVIWAMGFLLTMAVGYYLLDICFKIAFAVIALPIMIALWPFNLTKSQLSSCVSIIIKSSATFAFLAITTSYAVELVNAAFVDGKAAFYEALDNNDKEFINEYLSLFGLKFYIMLFCFIYGYKLIGGTVKRFVDKYFGDSIFGSAAPMHSMATAATKYVKDKAVAPARLATDIVTHQAGKVPIKAAKYLRNKAQSATQGGGSAEGNAMRSAGSAVKGAGKTTKQTGRAVKNIGKGADKLADGLNKTKFGAVLGVPLKAAAQATKVAGTAMEKTGEQMEKRGESMKKEADKIDKRHEQEKQNRQKQ